MKKHGRKILSVMLLVVIVLFLITTNIYITIFGVSAVIVLVIFLVLQLQNVEIEQISSTVFKKQIMEKPIVIDRVDLALHFHMETGTYPDIIVEEIVEDKHGEIISAEANVCDSKYVQWLEEKVTEHYMK